MYAPNDDLGFGEEDDSYDPFADSVAVLDDSTNTFDAECWICGDRVLAGYGRSEKNDDGQWAVAHPDCFGPNHRYPKWGDNASPRTKLIVWSFVAACFLFMGVHSYLRFH